MDFYEYFSSLEKNQQIIHSNKLNIAKSCDEYNFAIIASDFYKNDKTIFVVLPSLFQAQKYYDALSSYVSEEDVLFFPADELVSAEMVAATGDFLFERIQTLYTLLKKKKKIVVTNMHGAIKYEMNPKTWENAIFTVKKEESYDIDKLCHDIAKMGYEPVFTTVKTGQFSRRGSIVDVFPLGYTEPVRIDFFGDDIETIKTYNTESQRSIKETDSVDILPVSEFIYDDSDLKAAKEKIASFMEQYPLSSIEEDIYKKDMFSFEEHKNLNTLSRYLGFFEPELKTVFDFAENKKIYLIEPIKSREGYERLIVDLDEHCARLGGYSIAHMQVFRDFNCVINEANILIEGLRSLSRVDLEINAREIAPYKGNAAVIHKDLLKLKYKNILIISITSEERVKRLAELYEEDGEYLKMITEVEEATFDRINVIRGNYPSFEMTDERRIFLNESSVFDSHYVAPKVKYKSIYKNAVKISKYDELCIGDYVVHYDYGIGKYMGIQTLKRDGFDRDYLYIMYANNSGLYIPLEKISSIMKYASKDVEGVVINEAGGTAWQRAKNKVRKRVHDISDKLIALYAAREQAQGFAFPPDSEEQADFEAKFAYELTPDQAKAIDVIKKDMESSRPMDRLVCGDVGYGKTEVALRAAFKAVLGGKQVCMLAPTTILARQHYLTFKGRMEEYGVRVELLSRFVPAKQQSKIIEDLAKGSVDVIVGTHRVLSDEIKYHDLGLLIVDEEQRFGVTHKEKIKELKVNVDCITLSATPIPRTLQMSVMGIKDLSMIETPPKNRYPIQTYVVERNDRIIADAIERELVRGGQVFYLYNRVDDIDLIASKLHSLVPEARIGIGHGKLSKDQLENVITKFIDKEYDILLCTTIIETGIDMPDTNTLIIHDADRLGLSQMYQIRGRVGRSNKIAYAYLMYEPRKVLTIEAEKRLETIKEFNELGSGFKIAMRDLSIRGSGDILGEEQSGFVESVGLDVYLKILEEEMHKKKEATPPATPEVQDLSMVAPLVNRTISTGYINNDDARIEIHKKIDKLESLKDMNALIDELTDRFGVVDDSLKLYMYEKIIKVYSKKLGIYKLDKSNRKYLNFVMSKKASAGIDGTMLFTHLQPYKGITLTYLNYEIHFLLEIAGRNKIDYFDEICKYFDEIVL